MEPYVLIDDHELPHSRPFRIDGKMFAVAAQLRDAFEK